MSEICKCGREARYKVCPHIYETEDKHIRGTRATCGECSQLIGEDFEALCSGCFQKLDRPSDPQKNLEETRSKKQKLLEEKAKLDALLEEIDQEEKESQRWVAGDLVEEFFNRRKAFIAHFQPKGIIYENDASDQALYKRIKELDSNFPASLSSGDYDARIDRNDPDVAYFIDQTRNGAYESDVSLPARLQRNFKSKSDHNPFWRDAS